MSVFRPSGLWWKASISSCRTVINVSSTLRSQNGTVRRQVDKARSSNMQFTREVEKNGELFFFVCLVSRDDNSLRTTVYRKQTQETPTSHKATGLSTTRTLTRVQLVCNTTDNLSDENKYLYRVFLKNNYRKKRNRNSYDYSNCTLHKGHV